MAQEFAANMLERLALEKTAYFEKSLLRKCRKIYDFVMLDKEIDTWSGCLITFQLKNLSQEIYFAKNDYVEIQFDQLAEDDADLESTSSEYLNTENVPRDMVRKTNKGIVEEITEKTVCIGFKPPIEEMNLPTDATFKIIRYISNTVCERLNEAMQTLLNYERNPPSPLIELFFYKERLNTIASMENQSINFFNVNLNECQRKAVKFALDEPEVAIIHGPPGTGKTTTLVEILLQLGKKKFKILVCAHSNTAVDNLVTKLMEAEEKYNLDVDEEWMVRFGKISRVKPQFAKHSINKAVKRHKIYEKIQKLKSEMNQVLGGRKKKKKKLAKKYWNKIQRLNKRTIKEIFKQTQIVLTTLTSVSEKSEYFNCVRFDLVVIDDCNQAIEAAAWLALLKVDKCILAGDSHQLAPTVISEDQCLKVSLMERLLEFLGSEKAIMLTCQYRMHKLIQEWSSKLFYQDKLQPHHSVANHLLSNLVGVNKDSKGITTSSLLLINTARNPKCINSLNDESQLYNKFEVSLVYLHVHKLIKLGVKREYIGIMSPYPQQVKELRLKLKSVAEVEVGSIDFFQGREKEVIILSLVKSNKHGSIGLLYDTRRMNVAVTRAKRHLTVVCNLETTKTVGIVAHMKKFALVMEAEEYIPIE